MSLTIFIKERFHRVLLVIYVTRYMYGVHVAINVTDNIYNLKSVSSTPRFKCH